MKQVHILAIIMALTVLMAASAAQAVSNAAVIYLRVAAGARQAGMGEAFVSIADDATATYWNPAGLGNAPLAGKLEEVVLPSDHGEITDAVTIEGPGGESETWVLAGSQLLMYDGKTWHTGKDYMTSSDQTLTDFLRTIISTDNQEQLQLMAKKVVASNCPVPPEQIDQFIENVRKSVPADYGEMDDLNRGLDSMKAGFGMCLLNAERFRDLQRKLADGLKDSVLTKEEMDKITFSLDRAVLRFLPSRLMVPYSAGIDANMICLGSVGRYLWVGTDDGVYRRSGALWARYSVDNNLPSDTILSMDGTGDHLMIGTTKGPVDYYQGSFTAYPDLPAAPVTAITYASATQAYAAIGQVIYHFDGKVWSEGYPYTVRIDDSLDKIADRIAIYHTPAEHQYLMARIIALNENNVPPPPAAAQTTDSTESPEAAVAEAEGEGMPPVPQGDSPYPWLTEGNVIQVPYGPQFPFGVTAMHFGLFDILWVGTGSGLLSFNGQTWTTYGYQQYVVPRGDSTGGGAPVTTSEIAGQFLHTTDSSKIAILAANINEYNELNDQPVAPGDTVYVYSSNLGSAIQSIGSVMGELYVGTEFNVMRRTAYGWEKAQTGTPKREQLVAAYDFKGEAFFISGHRMNLETAGQKEFVAMFVKWLPTLDADMYYGFASYVHNARGLGTFGLSFIYLSYGTIQFTDEAGLPLGEGHPFELTVAGSFGTSINSKLKLGGTVKFIHSHLSDIGAGQEQGKGVASDFAVDAGILYKITDRLQFGSALTNFGPDIKYIDAAQADPLPRNLAVGLSYKVWDTPYNSLVVQGELNKMLVDLNHGFGRELEYAWRHIGAEYWYANFIALRAGYKYDKEGEVKHLTFGAGLQYGAARFDLAYIPSSVDSPLANTLRIAFSLTF